MSEPVGPWDSEQLRRRIAFLEARATTHLEAVAEDRTRRLGLAGGLLRDAAATAFLAGDAGEGRRLLGVAGRTWAKLGLFSGFALEGLATRKNPWSEADLNELQRLLTPTYPIAERPPEDDGAQGRESTDRDEPGPTAGEGPDTQVDRGRDDTERPLFAASAGSARQVLHLYQSLLPFTGSGKVEAEVARLARMRLAAAGEAPIGPTGLPLAAHLNLLEGYALRYEMQSSIADALQALGVRRKLQIRAAQADVHHWRMARQATDIVDLDLAALIVSVIDLGRPDGVFQGPLADPDPVIGLPLQAARALRVARPQFRER